MRTLEECKKIINDFAIKNKLVFEEEGEVGFGRECVGLTKGNNYVDYNPTKYPNYDTIYEFYDSRLDYICPEDHYHKHDCIAVLGRGNDAIRQLCDWVESIDKLGGLVVEYKTGATGFQALLSGTTGYTIKLTK
jgi:hypothetical protein